jgi:predicted CoA-substrate-specific enzyme activase
MHPGELVVTEEEITATARLPPLFESEAEIAEFRRRHAQATAARADISEHKGPAFLGIDSGSTTFKIVLIDEAGRILASHYAPHDDKNVVQAAIAAVTSVVSKLPDGSHVARTTVTGYGEYLLRAALKLDDGVVETVAHLRAARAFMPNATFVLDIGGQDVKAIRASLTDGSIVDVHLNEACSSGCGSFIQTLAATMGIPLEDFSAAGLRSRNPLDLGTRCTVFMNSRVRQSQKDGVPTDDISAGIALAVVRNALFKVIRLHSASDLADANIVVQGGTFLNDSVLRAAEQIIGKPVVRPDVAGLMGALGAALEARRAWNGLADKAAAKTLMLSLDELHGLTWQCNATRCSKCPNQCRLTVHTFSSGVTHVAGNRCERGAVIEVAAPPAPVAEADPDAAGTSASAGAAAPVKQPSDDVPNVAEWQRRRVFKYKPLDPANARRGQIGLPRVLSMWDQYPFWATCLTRLGF